MQILCMCVYHSKNKRSQGLDIFTYLTLGYNRDSVWLVNGGHQIAYAQSPKQFYLKHLKWFYNFLFFQIWQ